MLMALGYALFNGLLKFLVLLNEIIPETACLIYKKFGLWDLFNVDACDFYKLANRRGFESCGCLVVVIW